MNKLVNKVTPKLRRKPFILKAKLVFFFDDGGVAPLGFFLAPAISFFACLSGFILGLLFMQQEVIMSNTNT